jgi:hypothetical protein
LIIIYWESLDEEDNSCVKMVFVRFMSNVLWDIIDALNKYPNLTEYDVLKQFNLTFYECDELVRCICFRVEYIVDDLEDFISNEPHFCTKCEFGLLLLSQGRDFFVNTLTKSPEACNKFINTDGSLMKRPGYLLNAIHELSAELDPEAVNF